MNTSNEGTDTNEEPQVQVQNETTPPTTQRIVLKSLSKWAVRGLDLSEAGFSKLHSQESKYNDDKPKYDLQPDKFETWKNELLEKVHRMHAVEAFTGVDDDNQARFILKEYTLLTESNVEDMRMTTWPLQRNFGSQAEADDFTDTQIKSSCIGSYIHASLSDIAKKQLRAQQDNFTVTDFDGNEYFDGPSYFYSIADLVDPDNSHMIENVRKQLRTLDVKNFGFSVIKMLAEFKLLMQKIDELGGRYDGEDQFLDLWDCLKTMKEKEFSRYVRQEKDAYRKLPKSQRGTLESYIRDMSRKEVSMKEDNEWNVLSAEDTMIMALASTLEKSLSKKSGKKKDKSKKNDKTEEDSDKSKKTELSAEEKAKRKDAKIPDWKKQAPKTGESKTKNSNDKTYYWCGKCRGGKGLWALHKESEHKDFFKSKSKDKKEGKEVSFSTDTKQSDGNEPAIKVNKQLLSNAKAYLAQFSDQDFCGGGTSGH
jgi:hypothetical protein